MAERCGVGIDVAKATLEVAWSSDRAARWHTTNDEAGWTALLAELKSRPPGVIVLEATGGYETGLATALTVAGLPVAIVNPRQARDFAKALGILEKTDGVDAGVLALFAARMEPAVRPLADDAQADLQALVARRRQLLDMLTAERNPLPLARRAVRKNVTVRFRISIDGQPPGSALGLDVDEAGNGTAFYQRLHQLVRQTTPIVDRTLAIEFLDAGVEAFSFTFG